MARSFVVAFVALIAAGTALLQGGASAQTATATWEANPLEGPAGVDVVLHSQTPCPNPGDLAIVSMLDGKTEVTKTIINSDDTTGDWQGQIHVPEDTAAGKYTLTANCAADETADPDQTYQDLEFTVTEPTGRPRTATETLRRTAGVTGVPTSTVPPAETTTWLPTSRRSVLRSRAGTE